MKKLMLLDADSLLYKAGFSAETTYRSLFINGERVGIFDKHAAVLKELKDRGLKLKDGAVRINTRHEVKDEQVAVDIMITIMDKIMKEFRGWEVEGYMLGTSEYRNSIWPLYKANRLNTPKPVHYEVLKEFVLASYPVYECGNVEADDQISMVHYEATQEGRRCVVSSIDKDMDQLPGEHFNYNWHEAERLPYYTVEPEEAIHNFHIQLLTGDTSDNIPGLKGMGPVGAERLLANHALTPAEEEMVILGEYQRAYGDPDDAWEVMELNANLLWLWRTMNDRWKPLAV